MAGLIRAEEVRRLRDVIVIEKAQFGKAGKLQGSYAGKSRLIDAALLEDGHQAAAVAALVSVRRDRRFAVRLEIQGKPGEAGDVQVGVIVMQSLIRDGARKGFEVLVHIFNAGAEIRPA